MKLNTRRQYCALGEFFYGVQWTKKKFLILFNFIAHEIICNWKMIIYFTLVCNEEFQHVSSVNDARTAQYTVKLQLNNLNENIEIIFFQ